MSEQENVELVKQGYAAFKAKLSRTQLKLSMAVRVIS